MSAYPVIYQSGSLADFILHLVAIHGSPSIFVICTSREDFLQQLLRSTERPLPESESRDSGDRAMQQSDVSGQAEEPDSAAGTSTTSAQAKPHPLLIPTLRLLSLLRGLRLAFVTSVPALHAYLTTVPSLAFNSQSRKTTGHKSSSKPPTLALVNAVALHRDTATFSAQGLGRAFAAGIEAAWSARMRIVVFEHSAGTGVGSEFRSTTDEGALTGQRPYGREGTVEQTGAVAVETSGFVNGDSQEHDGPRGDVANNAGIGRNVKDVWDEEVPVLNAATKTFGPAGERRGWLGRTVKVRDVASRWFAFEELPKQRLF